MKTTGPILTMAGVAVVLGCFALCLPAKERLHDGPIVIERNGFGDDSARIRTFTFEGCQYIVVTGGRGNDISVAITHHAGCQNPIHSKP
jgi:hypothetical protein